MLPYWWITNKEENIYTEGTATRGKKRSSVQLGGSLSRVGGLDRYRLPAPAPAANQLHVGCCCRLTGPTDSGQCRGSAVSKQSWPSRAVDWPDTTIGITRHLVVERTCWRCSARGAGGDACRGGAVGGGGDKTVLSVSCPVCRCELNRLFWTCSDFVFFRRRQSPVVGKESNSHCRSGRDADRTVLSGLVWRCEFSFSSAVGYCDRDSLTCNIVRSSEIFS